LEIKEAQRLAWANKVAKGFNTSDVPLEFMLLHGEIAENFQAWRRAQPDLGEELADVALYLFALAEMNNVDLDGLSGNGSFPPGRGGRVPQASERGARLVSPTAASCDFRGVVPAPNQ
jgi:NTP pyrophosphatase (non-canonical NTP hydrolase)